MNDHSYVMEDYAVIKCIAEPTRIQILQALNHEELCVCELAKLIDKEQSLVSHHLNSLASCRLVKKRQKGKNVFCRISDPNVAELVELLGKVSMKNFCERDK